MSDFQTFQIMAKPAGAICNLDCRYCFYIEKEKLYPDAPNFKMSDRVLESFIKQKIEAVGGSNVSFAWQGGEPTLMGVEFFKRAVELQNKYSAGKKIYNAFQTNGILLNDEWGEFFRENNFLIGLSIDGPEKFHDKYRMDKGGKSSFKKVMNGINTLKKHNVDFNTLSVVNRYNSLYPLEVYNFLKEAGSGYMQFIPAVEKNKAHDSPNKFSLLSKDKNDVVTGWSVEPEQYGNFLISIFDEWVRNDVGQYYVQLFDVALESWYGLRPSLCVFNETCGDAMIIEHNGDLYSCDHYVYPEYKLGNIVEEPLISLVNSERQKEFGESKSADLPGFCLGCEYLFACNGECPKNRFIKTPGGEEGLNYLCAGYKKFFNHIDPYMKFMANQLKNHLPPANVMLWAKEKDKGFTGLNVSRNDLCPCGSGKKYKKCCMVK